MTFTAVSFTVLALVGVALAGEAVAATLYVRANGVDVAGCGSASAPCRSITAGVRGAADGDRIVVGPGRYGDLNGNGVADPGDERVGDACQCLVEVDRRVTLESEEGAAATIIDGGSPPGIFLAGVLVVADGAVVGKPGKGFTLTRTDPGIQVVASDVTIAGTMGEARARAS